MSEIKQGAAPAPNFAIAALMGAFDDEAQFVDPFGVGTIFTVRRAGSNRLQAVLRERAKGDKISTIFAQSIFASEGGKTSVMELAERAGINPVDVLAKLGEAKADDALARLVKWEGEPNGVPFNAGNARALLTHDGWLDKDLVAPETWAILEEQARKDYEAIKIEGREPFKGLEEIQLGDAYCAIIRYWSDKRESFRHQVLEEAGKN